MRRRAEALLVDVELFGDVQHRTRDHAGVVAVEQPAERGEERHVQHMSTRQTLRFNGADVVVAGCVGDAAEATLGVGQLVRGDLGTRCVEHPPSILEACPATRQEEPGVESEPIQRAFGLRNRRARHPRPGHGPHLQR